MSVRRKLQRLYFSLRRLLIPSLRFSEIIYADTLQEYVRPEIHWLDLECGSKLLALRNVERELRLAAAPRVLVGTDPNRASLSAHRSIKQVICAQSMQLPFSANSFDLVTANMVVERFRHPEKQLVEIGRVLKHGGIFLIHTQNSRGYSTVISRLLPSPLRSLFRRILRGAGDPHRRYYRMNSRRTIRRAAARAGFNVITFRYIVTDAQLQIVPFLAPLELLWIRLLMTDTLKPLRTHLIVALQKVGDPPSAR